MDYIEGLPSKEGGYIRTGSRTPMQWNDGKNHGFSDSATPYLPTDDRAGAPTVMAQENDEGSVLSVVKKLIALHKETPALWAEGGFHVLLSDYPLVYERDAQGKKLLIAINPSQCTKKYKVPKLEKILLSQNIEQSEDTLIMKGVSFIVAEES